MQSKSFLISFFGVFLVFGTLLIQSVYQAFYQDNHRPRIISCLIYKGESNQLLEQVESELQFVDRFIILQPQNIHQLNEKIKDKLKEKWPQQISFLSLNLLESDFAKDYRNIFSKLEKIRAFSACQNRDIILITKQGQRVNYNQLYQSLNKISTDLSHTCELNGELAQEASTIKVATYGALRASNYPFQHVWSAFRNSTFKRHFFFQTFPQKHAQVD